MVWCETPKSPPGDYNSSKLSTVTNRACPCETPKSPPGDYNLVVVVFRLAIHFVCETPKSPPGDYNQFGCDARRNAGTVACVKHLNPRQGITIKVLTLMKLAPHRHPVV